MNRIFLTRTVAAPVMLLLALSGCSDQSEARYAVSGEVESLSQRHRDQIEEYLTYYFGTASSPWLIVPDKGAEPTEDGTQPLVEVVDQEHLEHGRAVYLERCAGCHGVTGDGAGPAADYLFPRPRDYRKGIFKFNSTGRGNKPLHTDLERIIRRGAKGTSMPAFRWLSDEDMDALIDYVMLLSRRGETEARLARRASVQLAEDEDFEPEAVQQDVLRVADSWSVGRSKIVSPVTPEPEYNEESIRLGQQAFQSVECYKCHGRDGKGQTEWLKPEYVNHPEEIPEGTVNKDIWGNVAPAADLTAGMLHGGRRPIDVYRRIYAGINGTPMPAFDTRFQEDPETIWHLVHFILALSEGRDIEVPDAPATDEVAQSGGNS